MTNLVCERIKTLISTPFHFSFLSPPPTFSLPTQLISSTATASPMATAGEGRAPYESSGAGGKLRKRPFRRSAPATPYDRPATALRNNKPGLLTKLVDPASRLIYAGANKLFGVFRKRLPPLSLQGPPEINEEPQNVSQESGQNNSIGVSKRINQDGNSASISAATGISDLEQMLKQKTFTRSEIQHLTTLLHSRTTDSPSDNITETNGANPSPLLRVEASTSGSMKKHAALSTPFVSSKVFPSPDDVAKSYMGTITRPTTKLMNNTTPFQNTSITPKTANNFKNQENGFLITPRSHGRSAMYSMARTPYSRSPNQNTGHGTSLKRRSSVLEDDFGSVGPLRRTRQKPNLMLQSKKELGYTISQQPMLLKNKPEENGDTIMSKSKSTHVSVPEKSTQTAMKIFQQLESLTPKSPTKLTSNMLNGQALRSLEKVDSVKYLQTSQCNGESASTSRGKEKVEENGSRKFPVPFNMLTTSTTGNGDVAVLKESAQAVAIDDDDDESALKLPPEPPQKKRAFQMSAPEIDDDDDDDDDDDIIHVNGHVSFPPVENNNKLETSPVVNKPVTADILQVTTPPEVFKTPAPVEATPVVVESAKALEPEKAKPPPKTDGIFGEKETRFKFSSTFTAQKDEVTPAQKVSPFQFSEYKPKESSEPKLINSTSAFSSETKNDQFKVTNTDDKKLEAIPAATSASGMLSFSSSAKNSSGPTVTPDSTPCVFSSLASFPASGGNTSSLFNNTSNSNITPATTSSLSSPTPVFSFGSGKATNSMPESSNTDAVIEKEPKSTISSSPFFAATTAAATTPSGGGLFGFSSPAAASTAATTTTTTNGGGLFGFSSPAATSTTTAAAATNGGSGLFGFSAPAATSTTTTTTTSAATNGGGLFGFSAPAATSTAAAAANGGAPFGFSSPAATSTTTTTTTSAATNAGALFSFGAPAATSTTATATNGGSPFGFSAPATTSTTTTTAAAATNGGALFGFGAPPSTSTTTNATNSGALFGFSAPATTSTSTTTTTTTTASPLFGFSSPSPTTTPTNSFFNTTTTSQTNPSSTTTTQSAPFQFASGPTTSPFTSSAPTFGITPVSEAKSGNSTTTTVFGSSWQQPPPQNPPVFSFGASSSASPTPITFGAPKTTPPSSSSSSSSMFSFSSSSPVFPNNNNHITTGNDQMSMEDSMAEDSMQTPTPVPSPFGQPPGFMFGAHVAAPPQAAAPAPFQFGGPAPQNPFQSSSVEFNGGGGSFSLGSGGEKAGRRIVRVNKSKNRRNYLNENEVASERPEPVFRIIQKEKTNTNLKMNLLDENTYVEMRKEKG
ncbi:hypothetical protein LXL04_022168 [Taraxacum kok-saghyz]